MFNVPQRFIVILAILSIASPAISDESKVLPQNLETMISETTSGASTEEKEMISGWTAGKKLSEFFCQKRALVELGKTYAGADRVFLSMSDDEPPQFVSENRIKGNGSVRHDAGWTDIRYECEVDMQTGQPMEFVFDAKP